MVEVTENATKEIIKILGKQDDKEMCIRVYFDGAGWGGPRLGIALDKNQAGDVKLTYDNIDYVVDDRSASMIKQYGAAAIDFIPGEHYGAGFSVRLTDAPKSECGDCSSC